MDSIEDELARWGESDLMDYAYMLATSHSVCGVPDRGYYKYR